MNFNMTRIKNPNIFQVRAVLKMMSLRQNDFGQCDIKNKITIIKRGALKDLMIKQ